MFTVEQCGVTPDILVMAKGIASGFPFAAIGASAELMARWPAGSHGGTYGGNPIGCAAALATIDVLTAPGFLDDVRRAASSSGPAARPGRREHPVIADVRGPGLMVAAELRHPDRTPDAARMAAIVAHCREESRVLLMSTGAEGAVIRWMPPLIVSTDELDLGIDAFARALAATR